MSEILLDTHALVWWTTDRARLSERAATVIEMASGLAVCAMTWVELAWLARHRRIEMSMPIRSWLIELAEDVRTVPISPAIADTAMALPDAFPHDPADRLIYASAIEHGVPLVTKDARLRRHRDSRVVTVW